MLRPEQIALLRLGLPVNNCNGGGGSSSSSANTQSTTNVDRRQVVGEGGLGVSSDSSTITVNQLDGGAIARAFDYGNIVAKGSGDVATGLIKTAQEVFAKSYDALQKDREFVQTAGNQVVKAYDDAKGDGTQKFLIGIGVVAAVSVVAVAAMGGFKK